MKKKYTTPTMRAIEIACQQMMLVGSELPDDLNMTVSDEPEDEGLAQ